MSTWKDIEKLLRLFQAKPHLFLGQVTLERVEVWLGGFIAGCGVCGPKEDQDLSIKVVEKRGWKLSARGLTWQMREKGLSDHQIINELIEIQIAICHSASENTGGAANLEQWQECADVPSTAISSPESSKDL
jgi:hypothetical protein